MELEDRTLRIATLLFAHVIFLSAAALRIVRGERKHFLRSVGPWWIEYYPPLVWLPFLLAYLAPLAVPLPSGARVVGLAGAAVAASFAAGAMWSLGRGYGIRMDIFEGAALKTEGAYRLVRHPMYLGIVLFHVAASLSLASPVLLAATLLYVLPHTALRIAREESVLRAGFATYAEYARRVPALVPFRAAGASRARPSG